MSETPINGLNPTPSIEAQPDTAAVDTAKGVGARTATKARKVIDKTADRLSAGVTIAADKAQVVAERAADKGQIFAERASDRLQKVARTVDPIIAERPYAAIGAGVAVGLLVGLLLAPRPRIIYVKPRH